MCRERATVMSMENLPSEPFIQVRCPHCGQELSCPPVAIPQEIACPHCGQEMWISPQEEPGDHRSAELDGLRIRQLAAGRRATIRFRTYLVVGLIGCVVAAIQALITMILAAQNKDVTRFILWAALLVLFLITTIWLYGRLRHLARQAHPSPPSSPVTPPDFGPLSNGSQHWKNLEK